MFVRLAPVARFICMPFVHRAYKQNSNSEKCRMLETNGYTECHVNWASFNCFANLVDDGELYFVCFQRWKWINVKLSYEQHRVALWPHLAIWNDSMQYYSGTFSHASCMMQQCHNTTSFFLRIATRGAAPTKQHNRCWPQSRNIPMFVCRFVILIYTIHVLPMRPISQHVFVLTSGAALELYVFSLSILYTIHLNVAYFALPQFVS